MRNGNKTDNGVHEVGTEETRLAYQNDTPGQQVEEYLSQIALQNEEKQETARKHFSQVFDNPLKGFPHNEEFEVKEIKEKVEYAEYKFKNKKDAQKALDYFKSQQLIKLDINDDGLSQGELAIDAGNKDMTKQHKEVLKKFKPKVLTTEQTISEGKKIQDIARKHKRELQKIQKSGNLELSKKAEDELYQWATNSGEIHGDEEDEFWDWIDQNVDDLVKGTIKEENLEEGKMGDLFLDIQNGATAKDIARDYPVSIQQAKDFLKDYYSQKKKPMKMGEETEILRNYDSLLEAKDLMPDIKKIVDTKSATKVGGIMLDMFTASMILTVYDKVNDQNKGRMEKSNIQTLVHIAQKVMGMKESLDEGSMDGQKLTGQEISTYFRKNPIRDKDLKKAVEIALDHGGAMSYAIKQIEKLKKGLSKKTEVKKALQFANEEVKYKLNVGVVFTEDTHPCKGLSEDDPCWKDYKQVGMKKKNGKEVPNCVPKEGIKEAKDEPLAKMFKTTNKTALAGIMKMLDMTDVKVIQAMQKQNPKGFMKTVMQLGEDVMGKDPLKGKYPFQKKFSVESTFREMFETDLQEEMITYRVKGMQKPEEDKFKQSAKMMGLKITMDKGKKDTVIVMSGTKKKLRDFDAVARGKSSYGDPSTITHFDEK